MSSIIVVIYFFIFIIVSSLYKKNRVENKFITAVFIHSASSLSISIIYFLYLYFDHSKALALTVGINFIITIFILIPILLIKRYYDKKLYKLLLANSTQHIKYFLTFLVAVSILNLLFNANYVIQLTVLIGVEAILIFLLIRFFKWRFFSSLLSTVSIISFILLSIFIYAVPDNYQSTSFSTENKLGIYDILEFTSSPTSDLFVYDVVEKDGFIYLLSSNSFDDRLEKIKKYNTTTNESIFICTFEYSQTNKQCTNHIDEFEYPGGLEIYNDTIYLHTQNGLYYLDDSNDFNLLIAKDDEPHRISILYVEDNQLIYESNTSVYEVIGSTYTLINRVSLYNLGESPFSHNLVLGKLKYSDDFSPIIEVNGSIITGVDKRNFTIYTDSIFSGWIDETDQYFISINNIQYNIEYRAEGVLEIDGSIYVVNYINDKHVVYDPINSEIVSYIDERLYAFGNSSITGEKYFVSINESYDYNINEVTGFKGKTIVYDSARLYSFEALFVLPALILFGYAIFYEMFEKEERNKKSRQLESITLKQTQ